MPNEKVVVRKSNDIVGADFEIKRALVIEDDGQKIKRYTTANDEKILNACLHKMQQKYKHITREEIMVEAISRVDEKISVKPENRDKAIMHEFRQVIKEKIDKKYKFQYDEIAKLTGVKQNNMHYMREKLSKMQINNLFKITEDMPNDDFSVFEPKLRNIVPLPTITIDKSVIEVEINENAIPYLFALTQGFTEIDIIQLKDLKSIYSIRLYEIAIKLWKIQKTISLTFFELQAKFGTRYDRWADFSRNVLKVACDEINKKTDLNIEYKKDGRKDSINFSITKNRKSRIEYTTSQVTIDTIAQVIVNETYFNLLDSNSNEKKKINNYTSYKSGIKKVLMSKTLEELEADKAKCTLQLEAIVKIKEVLGLVKSSKYNYDEKYMVVRTNELALNDYGYIRIGNTPVECLLNLKKIYPREYIEMESAISREESVNELESIQDSFDVDVNDEYHRDYGVEDVLIEIARRGNFQYITSDGETIKITQDNIQEHVDEMSNRFRNSKNQYKHFVMINDEQKRLFNIMIEVENK